MKKTKYIYDPISGLEDAIAREWPGMADKFLNHPHVQQILNAYRKRIEIAFRVYFAVGAVTTFIIIWIFKP